MQALRYAETLAYFRSFALMRPKSQMSGKDVVGEAW